MQTIIDQQVQHIAWLNNPSKFTRPTACPSVFRGPDGRIIECLADPLAVPVRPELQRSQVRI